MHFNHLLNISSPISGIIRLTRNNQKNETGLARPGKDLWGDCMYGDSDRELFVKAHSGDIEAFEKLTEAYQKRVFSVAYSITGNQVLASDMTQEVFVRVFRAMKTLDNQALPVYIYRTAGEVCRRHSGNSVRRMAQQVGM